jgi:hypothetical protein
LWKCEINVGEYNTIDLVEENTKNKTTTTIFEMQQKGPTSSHHSGCNSDGVHKMAGVYVQTDNK